MFSKFQLQLGLKSWFGIVLEYLPLSSCTHSPQFSFGFTFGSHISIHPMTQLLKHIIDLLEYETLPGIGPAVFSARLSRRGISVNQYRNCFLADSTKCPFKSCTVEGGLFQCSECCDSYFKEIHVNNIFISQKL